MRAAEALRVNDKEAHMQELSKEEQFFNVLSGLIPAHAEDLGFTCEQVAQGHFVIRREGRKVIAVSVSRFPSTGERVKPEADSLPIEFIELLMP